MVNCTVVLKRAELLLNTTDLESDVPSSSRSIESITPSRRIRWGAPHLPDRICTIMAEEHF